MGVEGLVVGVDGHQHPLLRAGPLENQLPVGEQHIPIAAIAQGGAVSFGVGQFGEEIGEVVPLGALQSGAQGGVPVLFLPPDAPLAAIVHRRDPGHTEHQGIGRAQVVRVVQLAGDAGHVVVVQEGQQVGALVQGPLLRAKLAV